MLSLLRNLITRMPLATGEEILEEFLDRICEGEEEDEFQEAFAEGLVTSHPAMPAFAFQPTEIADLIAWLESVSGTGPGS